MALAQSLGLSFDQSLGLSFDQSLGPSFGQSLGQSFGPARPRRANNELDRSCSGGSSSSAHGAGSAVRADRVRATKRNDAQ